MQQQKSSMTKRLLSAEEVARELNVKKFLVRFWEKEFKLKLEHAGAGARCYSQEDLKVFGTIKDLIHNKKMSISQARKQLQATVEEQLLQPGVPAVAVASTSTEVSVPVHHEPAVAEVIVNEQVVEVAPCVEESEVDLSLVQPAVTSAEVGATNQEEMFIQNLRTFKEQLLNLKQLLDLE